MGLDFSLTREQEEIRDLAHEFAEKEMRPVAERYDENEETPWDVMRKAHALGLDATASFPEQYGGGGIDLVTNLIREEELSWGDAGIAVVDRCDRSRAARRSSRWAPRSRSRSTSACSPDPS